MINNDIRNRCEKNKPEGAGKMRGRLPVGARKGEIERNKSNIRA